MPQGLRRFHDTGQRHFTSGSSPELPKACSCYRRQPFLGSARRRDYFPKVYEGVCFWPPYWRKDLISPAESRVKALGPAATATTHVGGAATTGSAAASLTTTTEKKKK